MNIYNIKGELINKLVSKKYCEKDNKIDIIWNGNNKDGKQVTSGIYFYELVQGKQRDTMQMILLK